MNKIKISKAHWMLSIFILITVTACAHYQVNMPLNDVNGNTPYTLGNYNQSVGSDETFIVLAFSGGGTRAAALSYGVLEQMKSIKLPGTERTLLDDVDVISTVSGGSFTGAYYVLFGNRIFDDFKQKFLYRHIQTELTHQLINPINWYRLASPYFSRIDLASDLYDRTIFEGKTFNDLGAKTKRPFLVINATNLYQGALFQFTGDQFDYIGSDILSYPIARAVAASSAFPFLLSPISLINYPYPTGYAVSAADKTALQDYWINKERYVKALNNTLYQDKVGHPYIHLMDGGLADNIGLRAISDLYLRGGIREKILNEKIKRMLVIVVNAHNEPPQDFDRHESPPGLIDVAFKTCTLSMDNYAFETIESFKNELLERIKAQQYGHDCQTLLDQHCKDNYKIPPLAGGDLELAVVDLSFDNLSDKSERDYLNALPTTFELPESDVNRLIEAGKKLLVENPDLQQFLKKVKCADAGCSGT